MTPEEMAKLAEKVATLEAEHTTIKTERDTYKAQIDKLTSENNNLKDENYKNMLRITASMSTPEGSKKPDVTDYKSFVDKTITKIDSERNKKK